jgi:high-affinity iron transporter
MIAALLITLREGLEAVLIVGIVLSLLYRLGARDRASAVWAGTAAAVLVSVIAGVTLLLLGWRLEGTAERIFEGAIMLIAAGLLTWMIFWMQGQGSKLQQRLEEEARIAARHDGRWGLFVLAFIAVVREGIETALFLTAAAFQADGQQVILGGLLGLGIAIGIGWLLFSAGRRISIRLFFQVTGILLLLVAAGLLAHGVHELQEASLLPTFVDPLWNINPILDENGPLGSFLKALFGYNGNPSLLEVIVYTLYLLVVGYRAIRAWGVEPVRSARRI